MKNNPILIVGAGSEGLSSAIARFQAENPDKKVIIVDDIKDYKDLDVFKEQIKDLEVKLNPMLHEPLYGDFKREDSRENRRQKNKKKRVKNKKL